MKKTVLLTEASKAELRSFARLNLGLEIAGNPGIPRLIDDIRTAGYLDDTIEVEVDDDPHVEQSVAPTVPDEPMPETDEEMWKIKCRIRIFSQSREDGKVPVFVGVQGKSVTLHRDKPLDVRLPHIIALINAKELVYPQHQDADAEEHPQPYERSRYQYEIIEASAQARELIARHTMVAG